MDAQSQVHQSIGEEVKLFIRHIDSLQESLTMTVLLLQELVKQSRKKLEDFEEKNCSVATDDKLRTVETPIEHVSRWNKLRSRHDRAQLARKLVPRSILVSLVSQYDAFLGRLLKVIFLLRPELLNASEKSIAFSQAVAFPSIEAMREYVIEKEIESVLRSSHAEHFKWMENRFSLTLTKDLDSWPRFIELTERRNLFVHADGIVSSNYIALCKQHKVPLDGSEGTLLGVPYEYFMNSYRCIFEIGVKLSHVLWRKLLPQERTVADDNLIYLTYELIERDEYLLAMNLLDFACETLKSHTDEWHKSILIVNRAQAYKWAGKTNEALEILDKHDWSAKGDEFKLADAVLREQWESAVEIMRRIGRNGSVEKINYRDWPLFREFRKQEIFLQMYQEVFAEPFPMSVTSEPNLPDTNDTE